MCNKRNCWCCVDRLPRDVARTELVRVSEVGLLLDGSEGIRRVITAHLLPEEIQSQKSFGSIVGDTKDKNESEGTVVLEDCCGSRYYAGVTAAWDPVKGAVMFSGSWSLIPDLPALTEPTELVWRTHVAEHQHKIDEWHEIDDAE